jgi:proline iminopeptidase
VGLNARLAYAQAHPRRIKALVLGLVATTSRREVEWITADVGRIFPSEWERFATAVPERLRHLPLVDAYATLLFDPEPAVREHAAREWCLWEDAHVSLTPGHMPNPRYEDPEFRLRFARLVTHYWRNAAFLDEEQIIRDAAILNGIPGILIHGRYDVSSPPETPWRLSKRWSTSELHMLDDAGHGGGDSLVVAIIQALNGFAEK